MKKLSLAVALSLAAAHAFAAVPAPVQSEGAQGEAAAIANGAPAGTVMDGRAQGQGEPAAVVAGASDGNAKSPAAQDTGANIQPGKKADAKADVPNPDAKQAKPGMFSRVMGMAKKPGFIAMAGLAGAMAVAGFMAAGPLGAITAGVIGGLFGFIFGKALGG